jgi:hypothetical protein
VKAFVVFLLCLNVSSSILLGAKLLFEFRLAMGCDYGRFTGFVAKTTFFDAINPRFVSLILLD